MSLWNNQRTSQVSRDMAAQRLDCFLSVVVLFPNCLEPKDVELLAQRDNELQKIYKIGGYSFLGMYALGSFFNCVIKGRMPFFRQVV